MAVLDEDSGKLLNYRQLVRHTKYRDEWNQSSANEFGRLANGAGGRIKKNTQSDSSENRMYHVTTEKI